MEKSKQGQQSVSDLTREWAGWVDSPEMKQFTQRLEDLSSKKPLALALAALTVGVAAGLLIRARPSLN